MPTSDISMDDFLLDSKHSVHAVNAKLITVGSSSVDLDVTFYTNNVSDTLSVVRNPSTLFATYNISTSGTR